MAKRKRKAEAKSGVVAKTPSDRVSEGDVDLHSPGGADRVQHLVGTPVDYKGKPIAYSFPPQPEPELKSKGIEPPPEGKARILLAVPILSVSFKFFDSFLKLWNGLMEHTKIWDGDRLVGTKYQIGYYFIHRKSLHIADTLAANVARANKCTHLLFMDDDIYDVTPQMIDMLLAANKEVISGVMYASGFPYSMCTFRRFNTKETVCDQPATRSMYKLYEIPCVCPHCAAAGAPTRFNTWNIDFCPVCKKEIKDFPIQPVDLIPFCLTLIRTSVFDKIKIPWFHCNTVFPTDSWFADRCLEAGIQQYAHMGVRLNHRDITDITRPHRFNEGLAQTRIKNAAVQLEPEEMEKHQRMVEEKMFQAEEKLRNSDMKIGFTK